MVKIGGHAGLVEEVTLRFVRLRDYDGNVHFVPNGIIASVVNMSRGFAQAVVDIGVAYREDLDRVMEVMRDVGARCARTRRTQRASSTTSRSPASSAGTTRRWSFAARFRVAPLEQWACSAST